MEQGQYHYHHHHQHRHGHDASSPTEGQGSQQELSLQSQISEQQRYAAQPTVQPATVRRANEQAVSGIQATGSFHSVSSIDSSAEMARYFPDPQTPTLSPFRYHQQNGGQQLQQSATSSTIATSNINAGPYAPVPVPTAVQPAPRQPARAPVIVPQQASAQGPVAPQLPPGIPSFSTQIEGLSVSQAIVNDVIVDLQSKVINETQQQYNTDPTNTNYLEALNPIFIRAPNPTIILRSDLHRLRAQLTARPPGVVRPVATINQFQQNNFQIPSFPPPQQQTIPPECYGEYHNKTHVNT